MLNFLRAFTTFIFAVKSFFTFLKKEELKNAAQESLDEKDQRKLESAIGTGPANTSDYPGVYERPRKKND